MVPWTLLAPVLLSGSPARAGTCAAWGVAERSGTVADAALDEISGAAASRLGSGWTWVHEDSGAAAIHALEATGASVARVALEGVEVDDWEDVAAGPCPDGCACLYLGAIGADEAGREEGVVLRFPEPRPGEEAVPAEAIVSLPFRWPDGAHDAEALVVDPRDGAVLLLTREADRARIYAFPDVPPEPGRVARLEARGEIALGGVTGADMAADGGTLLVTSDALWWVATLEDGAEPRRLADLGDGQVEAVALDADGLGATLLGEQAAIWRVACADGEGDDTGTLPACPEEAGGCGCAAGGGGGGWWLAVLLGVAGRRRSRPGHRDHDPPPRRGAAGGGGGR